MCWNIMWVIKPLIVSSYWFLILYLLHNMNKLMKWNKIVVEKIICRKINWLNGKTCPQINRFGKLRNRTWLILWLMEIRLTNLPQIYQTAHTRKRICLWLVSEWTFQVNYYRVCDWNRQALHTHTMCPFLWNATQKTSQLDFSFSSSSYSCECTAIIWSAHVLRFTLSRSLDTLCCVFYVLLLLLVFLYATVTEYPITWHYLSAYFITV